MMLAKLLTTGLIDIIEPTKEDNNLAETERMNKMWSIIEDALRTLLCLIETIPCSKSQVIASQSIFWTGIQ